MGIASSRFLGQRLSRGQRSFDDGHDIGQMSFDLAFHRDGVQTDGAKGGGTFAFAPQARYQVDHGIVVEILCLGK